MFERLAIGERRVRPDGTVVETQVENALPFEAPDEVAEHENVHAFVAAERGTGIIRISTIPEGNSLGHVLLAHADVVSAAAPHALGHRGTGHDMRIVASMGASALGACAAARSVVSGRQEDMHRLAGFVHARRKLSGSEYRRAKKQVEDGDTVRVTVTRPTGERAVIYKNRIKSPEVLITSFDLPAEKLVA